MPFHPPGAALAGSFSSSLHSLQSAAQPQALVWNYAYPSHGPGAVVVFHIGRTTPMFLPSRGEVVRDDFEEFREAQAALVRSRRVLNSAINDPEVRTTELILEADPDPVTWLEANLSVSFGESRSLMRVELDGEKHRRGNHRAQRRSEGLP